MPDRRTLIAIAGGVTLTVLAGSAALAANIGILESTESDVGDLSPVSTPAAETTTATSSTDTSTSLPEPEPIVETIVVDEYVSVPSGSGGQGAAVTLPPVPSTPVATDSNSDDEPSGPDPTPGHSSESGDDSEHEDEYESEHENEFEDASESEDEPDEEDEEDDEEEYEGADDDD